MKRILTSAVALALLIGTPALAQDRDHKDGGGKHEGGGQAAKPAKPDKGGGGGGGHNDRNPGGGGGHNDRNPGGGGHNDRNPGGGDRGNPGGGHNDRNPGAGNGGHNDRNPAWNRNDNRNPNWNRNDNRNPNWNNNRGPNFNRGGGQRPRTFDRRAYQRNVFAQRKFRGGFYRKPPGWYYRRWTFGQVLPFSFFARDYWLNNYYAYDLPVPPYGYEWVRYGDDAILVDVRNGQILQVMYGVFY